MSRSNDEQETAEEQQEQQEQQTESQRPPPPWMNNRLGVGMPGGASPTNFTDTPEGVDNEADFWRGQAVQLEEALQDVGNLHNEQIRNQAFWSNAGEEGMSLEELLRHLWGRGIELVGVFAAVVFVIQVFGTTLSPLAQMSGAVAVTASFDRYIRPIISNHI